MITIRDVSFTYSGSETDGIRRINLEISKGECILLCGRSGCGKTTLTRLINGLIPAFYAGTLTGSVRIENQAVAELPLYKIAQRVGSVFQNPRTQFFNVDTDSEIAFGIENEGCPQERLVQRVRQTAEELHIENLRGRNIFELSGGEKQKIAFASVYAANPDIFVLDEPSSNLDFKSVLELKELIKRVKQQGKTIIIAEHRLWYLMDIVDKVILMKDGQILKSMSIQDFGRLSTARIQNMGLRCRHFSEIGTNINIKNFSKSILELRNIRVKQGTHTTLQDVSFTANGGEIIAITGANGAGKTTLARTICGLIKENLGSISVDGEKLPAKLRTKISYMIMQDVGHQLFTDSVETECKLGTKTVDNACVDEALSMLSLNKLKNRHPLSLSGGQKQRLAVAISMLCDKKILVFDEPTSGLDLRSMREVGTMMEKLSAQGKFILVITHDIEFIKTICSRVLIISEGKITIDLRGAEKENIENHLLRN